MCVHFVFKHSETEVLHLVDCIGRSGDGENNLIRVNVEQDHYENH